MCCEETETLNTDGNRFHVFRFHILNFEKISLFRFHILQAYGDVVDHVTREKEAEKARNSDDRYIIIETDSLRKSFVYTCPAGYHPFGYICSKNSLLCLFSSITD